MVRRIRQGGIAAEIAAVLAGRIVELLAAKIAKQADIAAVAVVKTVAVAAVVVVAVYCYLKRRVVGIEGLCCYYIAD